MRNSTEGPNISEFGPNISEFDAEPVFTLWESQQIRRYKTLNI